MKRTMRVTIVVLSIVLLLALAYFVTRRLWTSDPTYSIWCRLTSCPALDAYDDLCRAFAYAELSETSDDKLHATVAEEGEGAKALFEAALEHPAPERAAFILESAKEAGAPDWRCPALERQIADL